MNRKIRPQQIDDEISTSLNSATFLLKFREQAHMDWFGRFTDSEIQSDYLQYCYLQDVPVCFFIAAAIFLIWSLFETSASLTFRSNVSHEYGCGLFSYFLILTCIMAGAIIFSYSKQKKNTGPNCLQVIPRQSAQLLFTVCFNILFLFKMAKYFIFDPEHCLTMNNRSFIERPCHVSQHAFAAYFLPSAEMLFMVTYFALFVPILLHKPRLYYLVGNLLFAFVIFLYCFHTSSFGNIFPLLVTQVLVVMLFCRFHYERMQSFVYYRYSHTFMQEQLRMEELQKENREMRQLVGNVAHDLKTPLASFTTGVKVIQDLLKNSQDTIKSLSTTQADILTETNISIDSCLTNIRNTTAFMFMSINRVLDFTKVNEKKKLVPNYETVHLDEVLHFPVECMSNIQERIEIQLQPIAAEICSHVITDKQWLQENILCLLSNAVKYSSEGPVTVSVHLLKSSSEKHEVVTRSSSPVVSRPPAIHIPVIPSNSVVPFSNAPAAVSSPSATVRLSFKTSAFFPNQTIYRNNSDSFHRETDRTVDNHNNNNNISSPVPGESQMFLLFEVEDHGIGMSEEARANLFSPFQQAQSLAGGTGLGLFSLSKRIEALKGSYGVKSRKDGAKGSLFWFTIPYRADQITASTKDPDNPPPSGSGSGSGSGSRLSILKSLRILQNSFKSHPLELLLVDDSPSILKMASMMLKRQGHSITVAENGEIALKKVEERWKTVHKGFDVILMDLQMPIMDGLEATKRLRKMEKGKCDWMKELSSNKTENLNEVVPDKKESVHQLIFGTSANSDEPTKQAAYEAGVDGFLDKPFTLDSLLALLHEHNVVPTVRN